MNAIKQQMFGLGMLVAAVLLAPVASASVPAGWSCTGSCDSVTAADGVVSMPPNGSSDYQWISTDGGEDGVGGLPTGPLGNETNGSTLATSLFTVNAGAELNFWFNYVTSDGSGYADYAWAALFDSSNNLVSLLFTARTAPSGSIVPGFGMPPVNATLNPGSVPIIPGGPVWSPLGGSSGACYDDGCGYTGWVNANFIIAGAGDYYLMIGATNWSDAAFDSGLAMSGVTIDGVPIEPPTGVPEPGVLGMFGLGALLLGGLAALRRRRFQG